MSDDEFRKFVEYVVCRLKALVDVVSTEALRLSDLSVSQEVVDAILEARAMEVIFPMGGNALPGM